MSLYQTNKRPRNDNSSDTRRKPRKQSMKRKSTPKGRVKPDEAVRKKSLMRMRQSQLLRICGKLKIKKSLSSHSCLKKKEIVDHIIYHEYYSNPKVFSFDDVVERRVKNISMSIAPNVVNDNSSHSDLDANDEIKSVHPKDDSSQSLKRIQYLDMLEDDDSKSANEDPISEDESVHCLEVMSFENILRGSGHFSSSLVDVLSKVDPQKDIVADPSPKNSILTPPASDNNISRSDITRQLMRMSYDEEEIMMALQKVVDQDDINDLVERMEAERQKLN